MDLGSTVIGAIIIIICTLPFIFISRSRKKRENQMLKTLTDIANQHNGKVTKHELITDFAIGIDEINNYVFFFKKEKDISQYIDIADIQICKVINTSRSTETNDDNFKSTELFGLTLIPIEKNKPAIDLEFYNSEKSIQLIGREELQTVEKWSKIINDRLKSKQ